MEPVGIREEAHRLIDRLPDVTSWDDLMHKIFVRQAIETGVADSKAGRTMDVEDVRAEFDLPK